MHFTARQRRSLYCYVLMHVYFQTILQGIQSERWAFLTRFFHECFQLTRQKEPHFEPWANIWAIGPTYLWAMGTYLGPRPIYGPWAHIRKRPWAHIQALGPYISLRWASDHQSPYIYMYTYIYTYIYVYICMYMRLRTCIYM